MSKSIISFEDVVFNAAAFSFRHPPLSIRSTDEMVVLLISSTGEQVMSVPTSLLGRSIALNLPRQIACFTMIVCLDRIFERPELAQHANNPKVFDILTEALRFFLSEIALPFTLSVDDFLVEFTVHQKSYNHFMDTPLTDPEVKRDKALSPSRFAHANAFAIRAALFDDANKTPSTPRSQELVHFATLAFESVNAGFVRELQAHEITLE